jgi:8-oxo-dGTP diphosphatase
MKYAKVLAKAVIANEKNEVLLLKRHEGSKHRPGQWDFAGGKTDDYEDFTAAAIREIFEETGIKFGHENLHLIWTASTVEDSETVCRLYYFGCTENSEVELSSEHEGFVWLKLDEAIEAQTYKRHQDVLKYVRDKSLIANS